MASPTQRTWVWVNSGSWWWTGRPGMLQSTGLQRIRHDWATEQHLQVKTERLPKSLIIFAKMHCYRDKARFSIQARVQSSFPLVIPPPWRHIKRQKIYNREGGAAGAQLRGGGNQGGYIVEITSELDPEGGRWMEAGHSRKRELYGKRHRSVRKGGVSSNPQTILCGLTISAWLREAKESARGVSQTCIVMEEVWALFCGWQGAMNTHLLALRLWPLALTSMKQAVPLIDFSWLANGII